MKLFAFLMITASLMQPVTSFAQESQSRAEPTDEVIATGTVQRDKAMSAFLAGDYVTADIEFDRNAFCALRASRNFTAGVEAARDSTIRANVGVDANSAPQPTGGLGGASPTPTAPTATPSFNINSSNFQKDESIAPRTCEDRGFQLYMRGLSEIKLGKLDEAKESFERAVVLRKSIYDAYFRLALLEYQEGDLKKANKNFKRLKKFQKSCRDCESKEEINAQIAYLQKTLG